MSTSLRSRLAQPWAHERSLTAMLIFLVINVVVVYPLSAAGIAGHVVFGIIFGLLLVSGIAATARNTAVLVVFTVIAIIGVAIHWVRYVDPTPALQLADLAASLVSSAMLSGILLVQVFREGEVTSARVQGAVAIYLLLAMTWAFAYALVATLDPSAFQETTTVPANEIDTHRYLYFSFVTLTTLGLGDILPMSPLARLLVILESTIGQLFPVILIARLVSLELYYRQRHFEQQQATLDRRALTREIARELEALREERR
ncbi:two pore domain potassium channel family protein [bacterium]|nr:two pore domain potassium channel family protein [bacterium]